MLTKDLSSLFFQHQLQSTTLIAHTKSIFLLTKSSTNLNAKLALLQTYNSFSLKHEAFAASKHNVATSLHFFTACIECARSSSALRSLHPAINIAQAASLCMPLLSCIAVIAPTSFGLELFGKIVRLFHVISIRGKVSK